MSTPPPQPPRPAGPGPSWPPPQQPGWGPPPGPAGPPALNGFALASLLVGLLCFPPLGVVFGLVALVQIRRRRERGRALAVVGLAVSLTTSAVLLYGVAGYARPFLERLASRPEPERVEGQLTDMGLLRAGDCFNVPGGDLLDETPFTYRTDCAQVHDAEVTSATTLGPGPFPGASKLKDTATEACWKAQDAYAMDTWALPDYAEMYYFAPTREAWRAGDRRLTCVIGTSGQEHKGSLRKDAGMLTADQVSLLTALNGADGALGRAPERELDEALPEYRAWAREVDGALAAEERMLGEAVAAHPEAGARLKELAVARGAWQRAARAVRPADFERAREEAEGALTTGTEKALRGAYGLATRVPEWLEESPSGPGRGPSSDAA
ncbi:DUF4190 domain-containing protein [Streptomyces racemochromogenes]|uniref:DUF4190 domain-containing protein n=1 Tax=Streptomyces racemochromogenes TaxID=67353 RepID=A0ABW7PIZ2_9ACTN